jgi:hypothetical protein
MKVIKEYTPLIVSVVIIIFTAYIVNYSDIL